MGALAVGLRSALDNVFVNRPRTGGASEVPVEPAGAMLAASAATPSAEGSTSSVRAGTLIAADRASPFRVSSFGG